MFELIAIAALAVSGISAIGSSLWALSVYMGKRRKQTVEHLNETRPENPTKFEVEPAKLELGIGSSTMHTSSPVSEEMRNQVMAVAKAWSEMRALAPGDDWEEAAKLSIATLVALHMAQETLDLDTPRIDYRQFIDRSRPEDIEDIFRSGRHRASLA